MAQRKRKPKSTIKPTVSVQPETGSESLTSTEHISPSIEPTNVLEGDTATPTTLSELPEEVNNIEIDEYVGEQSILPTGRVMNGAQYQELKNQGLPPHLTLWEIEESPYTEGRKILVFYNGEKPVTHMEISEETTEDLLTALNHEIAYTAPESADSWFIKTPDAGNSTPYLHLTSNGAIVDSLPLTKPFMKEIMPQLLKVYNPIQEAKQKGFVPWATKHKIKSGLLIALLSFMFIYGTFTYFF
jgi:hypothetical protein